METTSAPPVRDRGVRARMPHLGVALAVAGSVLVLGALAGGLTAGTAGALGVGAGVLLVAFSYTLSTLGISWADSVSSQLVLPMGMGLYVTKFTVFGLVMFAINQAGWAGAVPMGIGICLGVAAWTATQIWWTVHHDHPYVGPANPY